MARSSSSKQPELWNTRARTAGIELKREGERGERSLVDIDAPAAVAQNGARMVELGPERHTYVE